MRDSSHDFPVVSCNDDRSAVLVRANQKTHDEPGILPILRARRLVREDQLRLASKCSNNRHSLLLPFREFASFIVLPMMKPCSAEKFLNFLKHLLRFTTSELRWNQNILENR